MSPTKITAAGSPLKGRRSVPGYDHRYGTFFYSVEGEVVAVAVPAKSQEASPGTMRRVSVQIEAIPAPGSPERTCRRHPRPIGLRLQS